MQLFFRHDILGCVGAPSACSPLYIQFSADLWTWRFYSGLLWLFVGTKNENLKLQSQSVCPKTPAGEDNALAGFHVIFDALTSDSVSVVVVCRYQKRESQPIILSWVPLPGAPGSLNYGVFRAHIQPHLVP